MFIIIRYKFLIIASRFNQLIYFHFNFPNFIQITPSKHFFFYLQIIILLKHFLIFHFILTLYTLTYHLSLSTNRAIKLNLFFICPPIIILIYFDFQSIMYFPIKSLSIQIIYFLLYNLKFIIIFLRFYYFPVLII
jgi:hypothetical protein